MPKGRRSDRREVAAALGCHPNTVDGWRRQGFHTLEEIRAAQARYIEKRRNRFVARNAGIGSGPPSEETLDRLMIAIGRVLRGEIWPRDQGGDPKPGEPSLCQVCGESLTPDTWCGQFSPTRKPGQYAAVNICTKCQVPRVEYNKRRQRRLTFDS